MAPLGSSEGVVPGGARVRIIRFATPSEAARSFAAWGGHTQLNQGVRQWWDPSARLYGGYEIHAEPLGNGQFNVVILGLGGTMEGYRRQELPVMIPPLIVRAGEPFEVELFRSGGDRLFDRVVVAR